MCLAYCMTWLHRKELTILPKTSATDVFISPKQKQRPLPACNSIYRLSLPIQFVWDKDYVYNYTSNGVDIHLTVCVQIVVFFRRQRLITQ